MADNREIEALREGYEISIRQMRTLLTAQARLRATAEQTANEIRDELKKLAQSLCPGLVDTLRKESPVGLEVMEPTELVAAIVRDIRHRLSRLDVAEATGRSLTEMYDGVIAENEQLREENTRLMHELADALDEKERVEARLAVFQKTLEGKIKADSMEVQLGFSDDADSLSPNRMPGWIQKWQRSSTYERDVVLLQILAETGVPRRSDVAVLFAERLNLGTVGGGGIQRAFKRAARDGWIELVEVKSSLVGRSLHHLVRLTEKGQDAARLIFNTEPVPSQATELLKRHRSGAHALLNLEAADMLREAGYEVDLFPARIELSGKGEKKRLFLPDLVASRHGRTIFVEVERDTRKNPDERNRKWDNYCVATGGEFYIVVPGRAALDAIKSEILYWAGPGRQHKLKRLWMSSLSDAMGKKGDDIWTHKRGK